MAQSKILRSKAAYFVGRFIVRLFLPMMRYAAGLWNFKRFDGVAIGELRESDPASRFNQVAGEALELIKAWDERRYHRVIRNIDYVANYRGFYGRRFSCMFKFCLVDYDKFFTTHNAEWNVRAFACTLIQAATTGVLERRSIPIYWKNSRRVLRLQSREAHSFVMRIDPVWAAEYLNASDEL